MNKFQLSLLIIVSSTGFFALQSSIAYADDKIAATKLIQQGFELFSQASEMENRANALIADRSVLVKKTAEIRQQLVTSSVLSVVINQHLKHKDYPADLYLLSEKASNTGADLRNLAEGLKRYAKQLMDLGFNALWAEHLTVDSLVKIRGTGAPTGKSELMQMTFASQNRPGDLDLEPGKPTANGLYYAHIQSSTSEIQLNQIHHWKIILLDAKGNAVRRAKLQLSGDMPSHMHGLATEPKIIETGIPGVYEIHGMKFQMRGWWTLDLQIETSQGKDRVIYNMDL